MYTDPINAITTTKKDQKHNSSRRPLWFYRNMWKTTTSRCSCNVYFSYIDTIQYLNLENKKILKICVPFLLIFYRLSVTVIFFNHRGMDCWSVRIKNVEFKNISWRNLTWQLQWTPNASWWIGDGSHVISSPAQNRIMVPKTMRESRFPALACSISGHTWTSVNCKGREYPHPQSADELRRNWTVDR